MKDKITVEIKETWLINYIKGIKEKNGMSYREIVEECIADAALKQTKQNKAGYRHEHPTL